MSWQVVTGYPLAKGWSTIKRHVIFLKRNYKKVAKRRELGCLAKRISRLRQSKCLSPYLRVEKTEGWFELSKVMWIINRKSNIRIYITLLLNQYFFCYYLLLLWSPLDAAITKAIIYRGSLWSDTVLNTLLIHLILIRTLWDGWNYFPILEMRKGKHKEFPELASGIVRAKIKTSPRTYFQNHVVTTQHKIYLKFIAHTLFSTFFLLFPSADILCAAQGFRRHARL